MSSIAVVSVMATPVLSPFWILAAGAGAAVAASRFALDVYADYKDAKKSTQRAAFVASLRDNLKNTVAEFKSDIDNLHADNSDHLLEKLSQIEAFDRTLQLANTQQAVQEAVIKFGQHYGALKAEIEAIKVEQRQTRKTEAQKTESINAATTELTGHHPTPVTAATIDTAQQTEQRHMRQAETTPIGGKGEREEIVAEAWLFYNRIRDIDPDYVSELTPLANELDDCPYSQRLQLIRTTMKLHYGKVKALAAETNSFRDMLEKLLGYASQYDGAAEVSPTIETLFSQKYINRQQYDNGVAQLTEFVAKAEERIARQRLIRKLKDNIESLGYAIAAGDDAASPDVESLTSDLLLKIDNGQVVYIDTQWQDYKVMLKLNQNAELTTRLVKLVQSQQQTQDVPTNQRQRDMEIARKWCEDYDKFLEKFRQEHLSLGLRLRKEPQEQDILYIVDNRQQIDKHRQEKTDSSAHNTVRTAD
ncbi:MAG: hypothetical protein HQL05_12895 [Nitrospirae bacterium]|uniref:hypothetical protein n=1 Tax=Candidatus Magnetobacterium casense TaxID=1455061 RepID=UPI00058B0204|nr:hypothetical protein [Candidatus Magnetobacterium casensis]MBF0338713.1 hypothetical protein [Nitrospirota bacterium]